MADLVVQSLWYTLIPVSASRMTMFFYALSCSYMVVFIMEMRLRKYESVKAVFALLVSGLSRGLIGGLDRGAR